MTIDDKNCYTQFSAELPENLQLHVRHIFPGSCLLLNTSTRHYQVASAGSAYTVRPDDASTFYSELLDFSPQNLLSKRPLEDLLRQYTHGALDGMSFVMVLTRIPPLFCNWWGEQMRALRRQRIKLHVHILVLTDMLCHARGQR